MKPLLAALVLVAFAATGMRCVQHSTGTSYTGTYVSLGDSVAAGNGASDKDKTSYVALLAADEGNLPLLTSHGPLVSWPSSLPALSKR